jgi:hypothetical protein
VGILCGILRHCVAVHHQIIDETAWCCAFALCKKKYKKQGQGDKSFGSLVSAKMMKTWCGTIAIWKIEKEKNKGIVPDKREKKDTICVKCTCVTCTRQEGEEKHNLC